MQQKPSFKPQKGALQCARVGNLSPKDLDLCVGSQSVMQEQRLAHMSNVHV